MFSGLTPITENEVVEGGFRFTQKDKGRGFRLRGQLETFIEQLYCFTGDTFLKNQFLTPF